MLQVFVGLFLCIHYYRQYICMYNLQVSKKKEQLQRKQRLKAVSLQKFVQNYYQNQRPQLLNNHNKRVNDFIRKIEHEPIIVKLDPYQTVQTNKQESKKKKSFIQHNHRLQSKSTMSHQTSQASYDEDEIVHENFKFKNSQDWTSLFTPWERLQRQKNYQIFKSKYGDPNIAFRSIGSQSQYHPSHNFRQRNQDLQINPPMKYTTKPTEQILASMKSKYSKKERMLKEHKNINKTFEIKGFDFQRQRERQKNLLKSSGQSVMGNDQIFIAAENMTDHNQSYFGNRDSEVNRDGGEGDKREVKKKREKIYFKDVVQFQQNNRDEKSRKILRDILTKCGVYRKKNRRAITDTEIDQFDKLNSTTSNN